jgi:GMP synthase (glutamine-hydrolysing)
MKRAAAIRHVAFEDLGLLEPLLAARGFAVTYLEAATDDLSPARDAELTGVLGGPIRINDRADYPFLDGEIALIADQLAAGRPTWGFCLGAQAMAAALGARIHAGQAPEIGWSALSLTQAGQQELAELEGVPVLHWHGETFELPEGARLLASTGLTPHQAFSFGDHALALQFHSEVTARGLERWFVGHTGEIAATPGIGVASLRAATARHAAACARAGAALFTRWLDDRGL